MPQESPLREALRDLRTQFHPSAPADRRRRALLPAWIRFFSWLFVIVAGAVPPMLVAGLFGSGGIDITLFGYAYSGTFWDPFGVVLALLLLAGGVVGYGLLWGKSWGLGAAILYGAAGLVLALSSIFTSPEFRLPLEPFLLVPFMIKLWGLRTDWDADSGTSTSPPVG